MPRKLATQPSPAQYGDSISGLVSTPCQTMSEDLNPKIIKHMSLKCKAFHGSSHERCWNAFLETIRLGGPPAVLDWVFDQWFFQTKLNLVWNFQDIDNGHQNFPNQSEFGLESASCKISFYRSKPNWNWFGKSYAIFGCNFSKPNWIWFGKGHRMKCSCNALNNLMYSYTLIHHWWILKWSLQHSSIMEIDVCVDNGPPLPR